MRDFFRGWQRKVGVATLVMACLFMAGWVSSLRKFHMVHVVQFPLGRQISQTIESTRGVIVFHQDVNPTVTTFDFYSIRTEEAARFLWECEPHGKWHWRICGVGDYDDLLSNGKNRRVYVVPYPSIVFPLALVSAYLLLSKPRPSNSKKIAEPTAKEGT